MARIKIKLNGGQIGTIEESDFDPNKMQRLDMPTTGKAAADQKLLETLLPKPQQKETGGIVKSLISPVTNTVDYLKKYVKEGIPQASKTGIGRFVPSPQFLKDTAQVSAGIASYSTPFGKGANFATKALIPGAVVGATSGVADEKKSSLLADMLFGATTAGVTRSATNALSGVAKFATQKSPERLMDSVFRENIKATKSALQKKEQLGLEALKRGVKGDEDQIFTQATSKVDELENALQEKLSKSTRIVPVADIKKAVQPLIEKYNKTGNLSAVKNITDRVAALEQYHGKSIPVSVANEVKRGLYEEARGGYGSLASESIEGVKTIARSLKEAISTKVTGANEINKELSVFGRIQDSMLDKLSRQQRNNILGLTGSITAVGSMAALPATQGASAIVPLVQAVAGSTRGKTNIAAGLNTVGKIRKPDVQSGKLDYLLGHVASRSGSGSSVAEPDLNQSNNQQTAPLERGQSSTQTATNFPKDGETDPTGYWKYDAKKDDWIETGNAATAAELDYSSDQLFNAMVTQYQTTGKVPAGLKTLYDVALKREGGGEKRNLTEGEISRQQASDLVTQSLDLIETNPDIKTGFVGGNAEGLKAKFGIGDQDTLDFNVLVSNLQATIAKARGGTSFTANEQALLERYSPKVGDSRQELLTKLRALAKINFKTNPYTTTSTSDPIQEALKQLATGGL